MEEVSILVTAMLYVEEMVSFLFSDPLSFDVVRILLQLIFGAIRLEKEL